MALKKYTANADATVVNAFQHNLQTRGTGANTGEADILESFSIYGRATTSSAELSRILIKFPVSDIDTDRTNEVIPASGNVSFYLRVFNAPHSRTVPTDLTMVVMAVSQSWQEGVGLDLDNYSDLTLGNTGCNWMSASNAAAGYWSDCSDTLLAGGSYLTGAGNISPGQEIHIFTQTMPLGTEDIEINITPLVEQWMASSIGDGTSGDGWANYGIGIHLSESQESYVSGSANLVTRRYIDVPDPAISGQSVLFNPSGSTKSFYTKRFFARGTEYFFKKPVIEARWNDIIRDDRGEFYYSSSLASSHDNLNTIYFYNYVRGQLRDIPNLGSDKHLFVNIFSGNVENDAPTGSGLQVLSPDNSGEAETGGVRADYLTVVTGGIVSKGIYSASFAFTGSTSLTKLYDVWFTGSHTITTAHEAEIQLFSGSIDPIVLQASETIEKPIYYINITNLRDRYRKNETARFNLYVRNKNWSPNIYTVANSTIETTTIHSASYAVYRILDAYNAVPYGTGSNMHTGLSYDVSGNYFDFNMNLLEPGYGYAFKFAFYDDALSSWVEQDDIFKFRVEDYEY